MRLVVRTTIRSVFTHSRMHVVRAFHSLALLLQFWRDSSFEELPINQMNSDLLLSDTFQILRTKPFLQ